MLFYQLNPLSLDSVLGIKFPYVLEDTIMEKWQKKS